MNAGTLHSVFTSTPPNTIDLTRFLWLLQQFLQDSCGFDLGEGTNPGFRLVFPSPAGGLVGGGSLAGAPTPFRSGSRKEVFVLCPFYGTALPGYASYAGGLVGVWEHGRALAAGPPLCLAARSRDGHKVSGAHTVDLRPPTGLRCKGRPMRGRNPPTSLL